MKSRTSMVASLVALAVISGGVAAGAASPGNDAMPMTPETCVSHHPEWSDAEAEAMTEAMQSGSHGDMAATMGGSMGAMTSMMGAGMGHVGWGR